MRLSAQEIKAQEIISPNLLEKIFNAIIIHEKVKFEEI